MTDFSVRRPLAISATIATSVAVAVGALAPMAHAAGSGSGGVSGTGHSPATSASPGGAAKLTLSNSAPTITVVGGTNITVQNVNSASGVSWSPDGSRYAYVDAQDNVVTAAAAGGDFVILTPPIGAGGKRSHPTWYGDGHEIVWAEQSTSNSAWTLKYAAANGSDADPATSVLRVFDFATGLPGGDLKNPDSVSTAAGDMLVFDFTPTGATSSDVYAVTRAPGTAIGAANAYKVASPGFQPSISADGKTIAYVAHDATSAHNQIFTVPSANAGATPAAGKVATAATTDDAYAYPVWSPDGKSIVFESQSTNPVKDVDTKSVTLGAMTETAIAPAPTLGMPAFQPQAKNGVTRLAGNDRLGTAIATSQSYWGTAGGAKGVQAKAVVLSRSDQFADALGGSALAAKVGGPLLLTPTAALNAGVQAEITRVLGAGSASKTIYILGGVQAVAPAVETALRNQGYNVQRVSGPDRYSTAIAIANTITGNKAPNYVLVATGADFPDALSAGAAAGAINSGGAETAVVVLTNGKVMPTATANYIIPLNPSTSFDRTQPKKPTDVELDSIGGGAQAALLSGWIPVGSPAGTFVPFTGTDRYNTSYLVAKQFFGPGPDAGAVGLATALNWADALSGGALVGTLGGPMLLVNPTTGPNADVSKWLTRSSGTTDEAFLFGGTQALGAGVTGQVGALISGPAGFDSPVNPTVG